jgi:hypothetical protein
MVIVAMNPTKRTPWQEDTNIVILPYSEFLSLLLLVGMNQLCLHGHSAYTRSKISATDQLLKRIIYGTISITILIYLVFIYRMIHDKHKGDSFNKVASTFLLAILIISNCLLILKILDVVSLPYLPMFMVFCFLCLLVTYRNQAAHAIIKDIDSAQKQIDHDIAWFREIRDDEEGSFLLDEILEDEFLEESNNEKAQLEEYRHKIKNSTRIASLQALVSFLGFIAIGFELLYDKVLAHNANTILKLEAPVWGHHAYLFLQIISIGGIVFTLFSNRYTHHMNTKLKRREPSPRLGNNTLTFAYTLNQYQYTEISTETTKITQMESTAIIDDEIYIPLP